MQAKTAGLQAKLHDELQRQLERIGDKFLPWDEELRDLGLVAEWNERERQVDKDYARLVRPGPT